MDVLVNLYEWEGEAGKPARKGPLVDRDYLAELDVNSLYSLTLDHHHGFRKPRELSRAVVSRVA